MNRSFLPHALPGLLLMLALPGAAPLAGAADLLAQERWRELAHGLSLRPPADATRIENTADKAVVKFIFAEDSTLSVYIRESPAPLELAEVQAQAHRQFQIAEPASLVVENQHPPLEPEGRPTARLTYLVDRREGAQWIFSQVFLAINPTTLAIFQLEVDADQFATVDSIFQAVVRSARLMPEEQLLAQRSALLQAGEQWLAGLREAGRFENLGQERWFRIVTGDRDRGYQRLEPKRGEEMGEAGLEVALKARIIRPDSYLDTEAEFFVSVDRRNEIWWGRTAQRGRVETLAGDREVLHQWSETGVRSPIRGANDPWGLLQVNRELPQGSRSYQWGAPPGVYASQAEVQLTPLLLEDRPAELMYYAYHPHSATLNLRHEQLTTLESGAKVLRIRPTPASGEQVLTFDPQGRLMRWERADGSVLLPATLSQIKAIHGQ
jgi:hypothetical protein